MHCKHSLKMAKFNESVSMAAALCSLNLEINLFSLFLLFIDVEIRIHLKSDFPFCFNIDRYGSARIQRFCQGNGWLHRQLSREHTWKVRFKLEKFSFIVISTVWVIGDFFSSKTQHINFINHFYRKHCQTCVVAKAQ